MSAGSRDQVLQLRSGVDPRLTQEGQYESKEELILTFNTTIDALLVLQHEADKDQLSPTSEQIKLFSKDKTGSQGPFQRTQPQVLVRLARHRTTLVGMVGRW